MNNNNYTYKFIKIMFNKREIKNDYINLNDFYIKNV